MQLVADNHSQSQTSRSHDGHLASTMNLLLLALAGALLGTALADDYLFVVDTSINMKGDRLTAVRQALMSFVLDGTERMRVGVVGFAERRRTKRYSNLIRLTDNTNKRRLLARLPTADTLSSSKKSCLVKGLKTASRVLDRERFTSNMQRTVIVITASRETMRARRLSSIKEEMENQSIVFHVVVIGSEATRDALRGLSTTSKGMVFYESESAGQPYTVNEALLRITRKTTPKAELHLLHMEMFSLSPENPTWTGYVDIDPDVGESTVFYICWMGNNKANVDFVIVTPDNRTLTATSSSKFDMAQYNVKGVAPPGRWTMKVTSTRRISVTSSVLSKSRNTRELVSVKTDVEMLSSSEHGSSIALITADVTKGKFRIANAKVIATVTRPNQPPAVVELYDDGTRLDSCKNDGLYVYSFANFSDSGWYNVRVTVTINDDGSMPHTVYGREMLTKENMTKPFKRMQTAGMFKFVSSGRTSPPSEVTDLALVGLKIECGVATLTWTAPGGNAHSGRAAAYEVRMAQKWSDLLDNFNDAVIIPPSAVLPDSPSRMDRPLPAGQKETLKFKCEECLSLPVARFRIRAVNYAGMWSKASAPHVYGQVKCEEEPRISEGVIVKHSWNHSQLHQRSARSAFLPDSCKCDVTTIKIPVCEQELTFLGNIKSVTTTSLGYQKATLTSVTIYSPYFPDGMDIDQDIDITSRCVKCKSFRVNKWFAATANMNPADEQFYTDGRSMVRGVSESTIAKTKERIVKHLSNCSKG